MNYLKSELGSLASVKFLKKGFIFLTAIKENWNAYVCSRSFSELNNYHNNLHLVNIVQDDVNNNLIQLKSLVFNFQVFYKKLHADFKKFFKLFKKKLTYSSIT